MHFICTTKKYFCFRNVKVNNLLKMAITKNPLIRYKILDECFRNPYKNYYFEILLDSPYLSIK